MGHVYRTVLPRKPWCLEPGWEGYRQMTARMKRVEEDPRILQGKAEINQILGLPRHAQINPPAEEPLITAMPQGGGSVLSYPSPLLRDNDGDEAHEFWEEDALGELRVVELPGEMPGSD